MYKSPRVILTEFINAIFAKKKRSSFIIENMYGGFFPKTVSINSATGKGGGGSSALMLLYAQFTQGQP
jgi:hypothetical protein